MRSKITMLTIAGLIGALAVWADFDLSVTPIEGGSSLRFGRVSVETVNREVRLRVSSATGSPYQLRQRLIEPLIDSQGNRLPDGAVTFYTLRGSNTRGSLYQDTPANLGSIDRVLYYSAPSGDNDSFIIAYSIDGSKVNASGSYFGKIAYSLVPQGAGSAREVYLNVYVDFDRNFDATLSTSSGGERELRLSSDEKDSAADVTLKLNGQLGGVYNVVQSVESPLRGEQGDPAAPGLLTYVVAADNGTSNVVSPAALTAQPVIIYNSTAAGDGDNIAIKFTVDKNVIDSLSVGRYHALLSYSVQARGQTVAQLPLDIYVEVKPVFEIQVISEDNKGLIFNDLRPDGPLQIRRTTIKVKSNLHRPYCVTQKVDAPLTSPAGSIMPLRDFTMRQGLEKGQSGRVVFTADTPLKVGDTIIYYSDAQGTAARFIVDYTAKGSPNLKAGDYYLNIDYALMEK